MSGATRYEGLAIDADHFGILTFLRMLNSPSRVQKCSLLGIKGMISRLVRYWNDEPRERYYQVGSLRLLLPRSVFVRDSIQMATSFSTGQRINMENVWHCNDGACPKECQLE
ncbi:hypothetical protein E4U54_008743 [Claviceps lovelessii]|nr:hypothetical protein E4U54_008743 [Claviceps lovelessii]